MLVKFNNPKTYSKQEGLFEILSYLPNEIVAEQRKGLILKSKILLRETAYEEGECDNLPYPECTRHIKEEKR